MATMSDREVAEKIVPDWQVVFDAVGFDIMDIVMDFQAGRKSAGQTMDRVSDFAIATTTTAKQELAKRMIAVVVFKLQVLEALNAEAQEPVARIHQELLAVARAEGIEIE